jgi:hypothetical protein
VTNEGGFVTASEKTTADTAHVSATVRFGLATACCGIFVVSVLLFAKTTHDAPLNALRNVVSTFWGVFINFAICLGIVAYVSRRLHRAHVTKVSSR